LIQAERKVEALCVVIATSVFDGEGVASEPLYWILLRIVLGDSQWFEFLREKSIVKPCREGGEAVVLTCGFVAPNFLDSATGIVAAARDTGDVAVCVASAAVISPASGSPSISVRRAPAAAASIARITMRDDIAVTAGTTGAVATLGRSTG
jgi:hypothetical protein